VIGDPDCRRDDRRGDPEEVCAADGPVRPSGEQAPSRSPGRTFRGVPWPRRSQAGAPPRVAVVCACRSGVGGSPGAAGSRRDGGFPVEHQHDGHVRQRVVGSDPSAPDPADAQRRAGGPGRDADPDDPRDRSLALHRLRRATPYADPRRHHRLASAVRGQPRVGNQPALPGSGSCHGSAVPARHAHDGGGAHRDPHCPAGSGRRTVRRRRTVDR